MKTHFWYPNVKFCKKRLVCIVLESWYSDSGKMGEVIINYINVLNSIEQCSKYHEDAQNIIKGRVEKCQL